MRETEKQLREYFHRTGGEVCQSSLEETIILAQAEQRSAGRKKRANITEFLLFQARFTVVSILPFQAAVMLGLGAVFAAGGKVFYYLVRRNLIAVGGFISMFFFMAAALVLYRTKKYRMAETEMTAVCSFPKLLTVRVILLGIENMALLFIFVWLMAGRIPVRAETIFYCLAVPFFLAFGMAVWTLRHVLFSRFVYCMGAGCFVIFLGSLLLNRKYSFYGEAYMEPGAGVQAAVTAALFAFCVFQCFRLAKETELPVLES